MNHCCPIDDSIKSEKEIWWPDGHSLALSAAMSAVSLEFVGRYLHCTFFYFYQHIPVVPPLPQWDHITSLLTFVGNVSVFSGSACKWPFLAMEHCWYYSHISSLNFFNGVVWNGLVAQYPIISDVWYQNTYTLAFATRSVIKKSNINMSVWLHNPQSSAVWHQTTFNCW